jgi:hypothetical protein
VAFARANKGVSVRAGAGGVTVRSIGGKVASASPRRRPLPSGRLTVRRGRVGEGEGEVAPSSGGLESPSQQQFQGGLVVIPILC